MKQTPQKDMKHSKSFKAPDLNERLTDQDSLGATLIRKKPRPIKELKEEYEK